MKRAIVLFFVGRPRKRSHSEAWERRAAKATSEERKFRVPQDGRDETRAHAKPASYRDQCGRR